MEAQKKLSLPIDLRQNTMMSLPQFIQNDTNILEFTVKDNGVDANLSNITRIVVNYKRLDKKVISRLLTATGNTVLYEVGLEEMEVPGPGELELQFFENEKRISTKRFKVNMLASIGTDAIYENSEDLTLLQSLFVEVDNVKTETETARTNADAATEAANTAAANTQQVADENKTRFLPAVASVAARDTSYPTPAHGDTVRVTGESKTYRFDSASGWVVTDQYNPTAIDQINADLAEKAVQADVRLKAIKLGQTDMTEEFLQQMTGTTPINAVPADKSVTPTKTSFMVTGKNMFNKATAQAGYYVYDVDGKLYANASYSASDYIEVEPSTAYTRNMGTTASRYAWYDSSKTFISGGMTGATITSPANAKYIRFSVDNTILNSYQFEKGSTATAYENFYYKLSNIKAVPDKNSVTNESLSDKSVSAIKTDFIIPGKNKFDKSKVTAGYYVNNANGVLQANANYTASDYIEVEPDTDYVDNSGGYYLAFYDANKAYISGLGLAHAKTYRTPANAKYIRLSVPNNIVSSMQFEKGTVSTEYQAFGYVLQNGLYQVASNATSFKVELNVPSKIYGLVGQELNIYFDNIVNVKDVNYDFDVVADVGDQFEQYFRFTPTAAGSFPITIKALLNGSEVASVASNIIVKASSVGTGVNKKLVLIGDSTTNNGYPSIKLNENFNSDPMDITLMGTRGTAPDLHEGRSGWKAKDYVESASLSGVANAFWNPNTSAFDFSYYITNNGFSVPDYVVINLGINDTFNYLDDASLNTEMTNIIARYDQMISSIKAYNANIKIGIALTIPPNYSQDAFGKAYDAGQTRARYKRNNFLWVQKLISTYQNREAENLYLVPIHLNIDTRYGYGLESTQVNARNTMTVQMPVANGGVHPGVSGYWQIADTYWFWLKSFES